MILLDTAFLVDLLRERTRRPPGPASSWIEDHLDEELGIPVFVACELFNGAERSTSPDLERAKVATLCESVLVVYPDRAFAPTFGSLLAYLQRRGETIATMDLLIACSAVCADAPLVTRNARHFERVPGLRVLGY